MDITISINTEDVSEKLKNVRSNTSQVRDRVDKKTVETMELLKKRLSRQSEPIGGSV